MGKAEGEANPRRRQHRPGLSACGKCTALLVGGTTEHLSSGDVSPRLTRLSFLLFKKKISL